MSDEPKSLRQRSVADAFRRMIPYVEMLSPAARLQTVAEWLYGIPVFSVCPCGCGLEVDTGRREPLITKEDAARLMEGI